MVCAHGKSLPKTTRKCSANILKCEMITFSSCCTFPKKTHPNTDRSGRSRCRRFRIFGNVNVRKREIKNLGEEIYIEDTSTLLCSETKLADWSRDRINPIELIGNGRPRYRSRFGEWHTNRARVYNLAKCCRRCLSPPTWKLFNETNCNFPFLWKGGKALPSSRIIKKITTI